MTTSKLSVYVMTSDHHIPALRPYAHLFNKYWSSSQQVIVCGFKPPDFDLPENFTFFSLGSMDNYPINKWTNSLIDLLNHFPVNDIFYLALEDYWLTSHVSEYAITSLTDFMRQYQDIIKMDMRTDRRHSRDPIKDFHRNKCGSIPLVKSNVGSPYHFSLMGGLWNRDRMLEVLAPNEDPWQTETGGRTYKNLVDLGNDVHVFGTDFVSSISTHNKEWCPIPHTLAHRRGDPSVLAFDEDPAYPLSEEDRKELMDLGYIYLDDSGIYRMVK